MSLAKRRKIDGCKASYFTKSNTCEIKLNATKDIMDNDSPDSSKNNVTREHLLLGIFQENICQKVTKEKQYPQSSKTDISNLFSSKKSKEKKGVNSVNKAECSKETKLIRIFPGPAGLVANMKNDSTSAVSYLNSVKESESKSAVEHIESNFSKSSQDEKNLLSEKAWKFLLDDLPRNFFNEYGIFTVKNRANASHCNNMKVKFIAGILDYIDHSYNDPFIILKDSTDSIEGTVHRDIPLNYPGILEPNVVVLLHDVGLLKTTTHIVMNKYHILISRVNLLAVYSNKGRIVHTSSVEDILSNISNVELTRDNYITPLSSHCDDTVGLCTNTVNTSTSQQINSKSISVNNSKLLRRPNEKHKNGKQAFEKDSKSCETTDKIFESFEQSMDMDDDMNDAFFTIENEPVVSNEHKYFNRSSFESTNAQNSDIQRRELQMRNTNCLGNTSGRFFVINSTSKIRSISPLTKHNAENSKNLASYFTDEMLHNNEFDSDDEILSQLDVDNIVSNSKK
ncbi:hypothetical protein EAI_12124 [Harpegnathos saltator]|uniref:Homologous recombination OB-fold protein OB-fold domain-containing protein n=2 Tax=Harpegnathos saltator TaxID=610380 RepID=E2BZ65_HARSA|nr:hypothetical protein EAI_12124 [Harpegnathos saltator]